MKNPLEILKETVMHLQDQIDYAEEGHGVSWNTVNELGEDLRMISKMAAFLGSVEGHCRELLKISGVKKPDHMAQTCCLLAGADWKSMKASGRSEVRAVVKRVMEETDA